MKEFVLKQSTKELAEYLMNTCLSVKEIASEFVPMLAELAEESDTLCVYWGFLTRVSLAFITVLGLARESGRMEIAEKAAEIMKVGFKVVDELKMDRYSCRAIEKGLESIIEILRSVDAMIKTDSKRTPGV